MPELCEVTPGKSTPQIRDQGVVSPLVLGSNFCGFDPFILFTPYLVVCTCVSVRVCFKANKEHFNPEKKRKKKVTVILQRVQQIVIVVLYNYKCYCNV